MAMAGRPEDGGGGEPGRGDIIISVNYFSPLLYERTVTLPALRLDAGLTVLDVQRLVQEHLPEKPPPVLQVLLLQGQFLRSEEQLSDVFARADLSQVQVIRLLPGSFTSGQARREREPTLQHFQRLLSAPNASIQEYGLTHFIGESSRQLFDDLTRQRQQGSSAFDALTAFELDDLDFSDAEGECDTAKHQCWTNDADCNNKNAKSANNPKAESDTDSVNPWDDYEFHIAQLEKSHAHLLAAFNKSSELIAKKLVLDEQMLARSAGSPFLQSRSFQSAARRGWLSGSQAVRLPTSPSDSQGNEGQIHHHAFAHNQQEMGLAAQEDPAAIPGEPVMENAGRAAPPPAAQPGPPLAVAPPRPVLRRIGDGINIRLAIRLGFMIYLMTDDTSSYTFYALLLLSALYYLYECGLLEPLLGTRAQQRERLGHLRIHELGYIMPVDRVPPGFFVDTYYVLKTFLLSMIPGYRIVSASSADDDPAAAGDRNAPLGPAEGGIAAEAPDANLEGREEGPPAVA